MVCCIQKIFFTWRCADDSHCIKSHLASQVIRCSSGCHHTGAWYDAKIVKVSAEHKTVEVKYVGWGDRYEITVDE